MKLIEPTVSLRSQFLDFYQNIAENSSDRAGMYQDAHSDFTAYISRLTNERNGIGLIDGYVPCSHFWLIDSYNNVLGAIRIRHNINNRFLAEECGHIGYDIAPQHQGKGLGTRILKFGLQEAFKLNIKPVLVTADEDNIPSRKVIEKNGGHYESTQSGKESQVRIARYWFHNESSEIKPQK